MKERVSKYKFKAKGPFSYKNLREFMVVTFRNANSQPAA
jgi:hypothetical protein